MPEKHQLPLLLDGATGTNLMRAGMPQGVCVEKWVLEHPDIVKSLQGEYAAAGSDAVMAPTFEANRYKLNAYGLGDRVADLNKRLVALSRESVGDGVLVAGDMSPTGLFVEPFGDETFDGLYGIFREQAFALKDAGADYIAIETMMSLTESRAALLAAKETGLPVTVTLTVGKNGRTLSGGDVTACLVTLASMGADAVGLNCSTGPDIILKSLTAAAPCLHIPLVAKPNAGLPKENKPGVYDIFPEEFAEYAARFLSAGAGLIGGCCGTTPEHIALTRKAMDKAAYVPLKPKKQVSEGIREFLAADERHTYLINEGSSDFSHRIYCDGDLGDKLVALSDEHYAVARIRIRSREDAREFGLNAYLSSLPVLLLADNAQAMEEALRVYQGRALIDSKSDVPPESLYALSLRYGAVII